MVLGAITGVPTPACLSAASNPVEAVTPPLLRTGSNLALGTQRTDLIITSCVGKDDGARGDEHSAEGFLRGEAFAEEEPGSEDDQHDAEFVHWRDA